MQDRRLQHDRGLYDNEGRPLKSWAVECRGGGRDCVCRVCTSHSAGADGFATKELFRQYNMLQDTEVSTYQAIFGLLHRSHCDELDTSQTVDKAYLGFSRKLSLTFFRSRHEGQHEVRKRLGLPQLLLLRLHDLYSFRLLL